MVATQSGLPVAPRGLNFQKRLEDVEVFMPNQKFLADVLQEKGYESHYVVGGDTEFGGIGPMYRTHQICQMTGIDAMKASFPADDVSAATAGWFVDDQMVLDAAREIHKSLLKKEQPYALIVETIGPHGPRGTISRKWTKSGKTENCDIPTSVSCLLDEVEEFLHDVRKAQASRGELRIVLLSDHLNHSPHLPKAGVEFEGYNTVIFWGAHDRRGEVVDKAGSMVDVFPTLLEWLGWSSGPVAAGIGRSLLSHPPTLVEEFGIPVVDRMITSDAAFANRIWSTPPRLAEVQATA
jgi:phosphoglycerol transferase